MLVPVCPCHILIICRYLQHSQNRSRVIYQQTLTLSSSQLFCYAGTGVGALVKHKCCFERLVQIGP